MTANRNSWLAFAQRSRDEGGLGLAPHQAAGVVGNLVHESGQDLNPWGPTGDNGTAWGTAQWRGDRLARLKARPDYQTIEGQQAFMREELDSSENRAYRKLLEAKTPEEAAHAWDAHYERSDGSTRDKRMASARQFMMGIGGGNSDPAPGALTSSYAPTESKKSMPALSADNIMGSGILNEGPYDGGASAIGQGLTGIGAALAGISNPDQAKALTAQLVASQRQAVDRGTWSVQTLPDGTSFYMNSKTRQTIPLGKFQKPEKDTYNEQYDTKSADDNMKLNEKLSTAASGAVAAQNDFMQLDKALKNPNVGQGLTGPVRNFLNKAYVSMGVGDETTAKAASDADIINSLGPKMALQVVQNGGDKLLPGSMSDSDLKLVTRFGNGEKLEPEANRKLLDAAIRANQRTMEAETVRQAAVEANGGRLPKNFRDEIGKLSQKWAAEDKAREAETPASAAPAAAAPKAGSSFVWTPGKGLAPK